MSIDASKLKDDFKSYDIHTYEEISAMDEYLVRIQNEYSYQEYRVDGENMDGFLARITFSPLITKDVFIYKLVSSYEALE